MTDGLITAHDVTQAVLAAMRTHLPVALGHIGDRYDLTLRPPTAFAFPSAGAARLTAAQLPMLWVSPTGTEGMADGGGTSRSMTWAVDVGFLIRSDAGTYEDTKRDCELYAAAIRTVLVERATLDGFAKNLWGIDEDYDLADESAGRTLAQGHVTFFVKADDAARRRLFYTVPGPSPVDSTALTTDLTVHRQEP